jgi:DNA polymerase-3 subunit delta'
VPNALLFAGPEGVGKKLFALELAKYFVCRSRVNDEACGKCANCKRVDVFSLPKSEKGDDYERVFFSEHPDVGLVIPYKNNVRVDAIRDLEKEAYFRPYEAEARFFIIDDAHKLKDSAANALLKTLEEPASTSHIVLITSRPDSLLQTIRSRSQIIRFAPVAASEIEKLLLETRKFSPDDARLAAAVSSGSVGLALSMDIQKFRALRESMLDVFEKTAAGRDIASLLQTAERMNDAKNTDDYETTLGILETIIRDAWLLENGSGTDSVSNRDISPKIAYIAEGIDPRRLSSWLTEIEHLRETFAVNINRKVATDALFMRMTG